MPKWRYQLIYKEGAIDDRTTKHVSSTISQEIEENWDIFSTQYVGTPDNGRFLIWMRKEVEEG